MTYINKTTGKQISDSEYSRLSYWSRDLYVKVDSGSSNFLTSAAVGSITGSALLGGLLGGSILGGIAGDLLDGDLFD